MKFFLVNFFFGENFFGGGRDGGDGGDGGDGSDGGDVGGEVDQGEVSTIRLGMLESSGLRKYSTLLVIRLFSRRLCLCHCLCNRLCLCICVFFMIFE